MIDYCKSTIYFHQHNNMMYVFTSIEHTYNIVILPTCYSYSYSSYIVILATCFDSYESSSGINIQELLVHIALQFFMS